MPESDYGAFDSRTPSPQEVNLFHRSADTDNSPFAIHHTLGKKPNQAAPGDHKHDDLVVKSLPEYFNFNVRCNDDDVINHTPLEYRAKVVDGVCHWNATFDVHETKAGKYLKIDLPVAFTGPDPYYPKMVGYGRENWSTGGMLQVAALNRTTAVVLTTTNGLTANAAWGIILGGSYIVDV